MKMRTFLSHSLLLALWLTTAMAVPALAAGSAEEGHPDIQLGQRLPEEALQLELVKLSDQRAPLSSLLGENGTLLVFTSNSCPYAIDWLDRFPRLATFSQEHEISFLLVNSNARKRSSDDSPEAMRALAEQHGFAFPYLVDQESKLADALGATRTPEVFLFDGAVQLVYRGALDDHSGPFEKVGEHWAADALRQMVAGEDISIPSTAALGCAVQRPRRRRPPPADGGQL